MLQQHLVVVTGPDGAKTHYPFVCHYGEVFERANRIFQESGGASADVWRGAERLYSLGRTAEG